MAQLKKPEPMSGLNIETLTPVGQYVAICLEVQDLFGVTRRKFQSQENETKDITRFVFGVVSPDGRPYLVQTYELTIAATANSNLIKFLTSWMGRVPDFGWDYCELANTGAMISVQNKTSNGVPPRTYSVISGIFPVPPQLIGAIPHPSMFAGLLASARQNQDSATGVGPQHAVAGHYANPAAVAQAQPVYQQPVQQPIYQQPVQQAPYVQQGQYQQPPAQQPVYQAPPQQMTQQPDPGMTQVYQQAMPQQLPAQQPPADWNPDFQEEDDIPF